MKRHNIVHMAKRQATSRIIAGSYKGTKLSFKPNKNLRPTESKTKETLFNWLLNDLHKKKCLDMYAGTGALGLEALSRGADEVVFFEKQKALCGAIEVVVKKLGINNKCRVINANSTAFDFTTLNTKFDLIFLDPPFHESLIQKSLNIISENQLLTEQGLVYIECERDLDLGSLKTNLTQLKLSKGGETKYCLYES
jgi:16S rRNA (guanine966-N2)-methyltransferase